MFPIKKFTLIVFLLAFPVLVIPKSVLDTFNGKVTGIKDGDTIEVLYKGKALVVRLLAIDCPEKKQAFGKAAKQFTSDFCFGKMVKIESSGKKDRYGRILATVYCNEISLNEALLKAGLAWHYKKYSNDSEYAELENQARLNKVGLWADEHPVAPWEWRD